jgi:DNA-binding response OmpR family regulator
MGRRGGLTALRWLRERTGVRRKLAVVVLSAVESAEGLKTAYDLGANSYLVKPFAFQRLIELARAIKSYWLDLNLLPEE